MADKASSTFLHFEVKCYPQNAQNAIKKDGLRCVLHSAKTQHEQGDLLFNNVLGPAAGLSTGWTKMNLYQSEIRDVYKAVAGEPIEIGALPGALPEHFNHKDLQKAMSAIRKGVSKQMLIDHIESRTS